jgi:thiamine biosynthesis lipoprotein ApbE
MTGPLATTWRALGTLATVGVAEPRRLEAAVAAVRAELAAIDAACSRFGDDAELVALNASAGRRVCVSPLLFEALEVAVEAARATGGAVDPTVGAALERAGYDRDLADIAPDGPPLPDGWAPGADWRSIVLDGATRSVLVPGGVRLDLGATAKALAADRGAAAAASATGTGVVLSLGGDVAVRSSSRRRAACSRASDPRCGSGAGATPAGCGGAWSRLPCPGSAQPATLLLSAGQAGVGCDPYETNGCRRGRFY